MVRLLIGDFEPLVLVNRRLKCNVDGKPVNRRLEPLGLGNRRLICNVDGKPVNRRL